jgi:hypothetical protein
MGVSWDITTCSLVQVDRRFRGATASIVSAMRKVIFRLYAMRTLNLTLRREDLKSHKGKVFPCA